MLIRMLLREIVSRIRFQGFPGFQVSKPKIAGLRGKLCNFETLKL
jgi:hypothetical protein